MNLVQKYIRGFVSLIYPKLCVACNASLPGNEDVLCTLCRFSLPETDFHRSKDNPVEQLFWGRINIERATSLLFFDKESKYRNLIHQLKYNGRKELGIWLGEMLGYRLLQTRFQEIDTIVPVPLHKAKLRRRGYNQSEFFGKGLSGVLNVPLKKDALQRTAYTRSQTRKGRYERWKNVEGMFTCKHPGTLENKNILLVDDVVTTGATLEAATLPLTQIPGAKIFIATIAFASL